MSQSIKERKKMYSAFIKKEFPNVKYNSKQFKVLMSQHACMVKDVKETFKGMSEQEILDNFEKFYKPVEPSSTVEFDG